MEYPIKGGQTVFDVVLATSGDLNSTYALLLANPQIQDVNSPPPIITITYIPVKPIPPPIIGVPPSAPVTSAQYLSSSKQSVFDITLQVYGDLNLTYKLILDSDFESADTYPIPGTEFTYNPQLDGNANLAEYLATQSIIIATV